MRYTGVKNIYNKKRSGEKKKITDLMRGIR